MPHEADDGTRLVVLTCSDVTAERDAVLALATAAAPAAADGRARARSASPWSSDGGVLLDVNDALCRLLGYGREELTGRTFPEITHPDVLALDVAQVAQPARRRRRDLPRREGLPHPRRARGGRAALGRAGPGRPGRPAVLHLHDRGRHRPARRGHGARPPGQPRPADRAAQPHAAPRARRRGPGRARPGNAGQVALLFCDLDQFKLINDSRGHAAGDAVLVETAERLSACIRAGDTAARLGGDEFVVLCQGLSGRSEAESVAQRLIDALTEPMARAGGVTMTVSIGIAFAEPGVTGADLLRNADAAHVPRQGQRPRPLRPVHPAPRRAGHRAPRPRAPAA